MESPALNSHNAGPTMRWLDMFFGLEDVYTLTHIFFASPRSFTRRVDVTLTQGLNSETRKTLDGMRTVYKSHYMVGWRDFARLDHCGYVTNMHRWSASLNLLLRLRGGSTKGSVP